MRLQSTSSVRQIVIIVIICMLILCVSVIHIMRESPHFKEYYTNSTIEKFLSTKTSCLSELKIALITNDRQFVTEIKERIPSIMSINYYKNLSRYNVIIVYGTSSIKKLIPRIYDVLSFLESGGTLVLVDQDGDPLEELFKPKIHVILNKLAFIPVKYDKVEITDNTKLLEKLVPGFVEPVHIVVITGWKLKGGKIGIYYTTNARANVKNIIMTLIVHIESYKEFRRIFENSSTISKWVRIFGVPKVEQEWEPIGGYSSKHYCIDSKCRNVMWYRVIIGFTHFDIGCYNTIDHRCNEWGILFEHHIYASPGYYHAMYFCPAWLCEIGYWATPYNFVNISNDFWYVDQNVIDLEPKDIESCSPATIGFSASIPELGIAVSMPIGGNAGPAIEVVMRDGKARDGNLKTKYVVWKWGFARCPLQSVPSGEQEFAGGIVIISRIQTKKGWFTSNWIQFTITLRSVVFKLDYEDWPPSPIQYSTINTQTFIATTDSIEESK